MDDPKAWVAIAALIYTVVSGIGGWFIHALRQRIEGNDQAIKDLAKENALFRDRQAHFDAFIGHTPTKDEFHSLAISVTEMSGDFKEAVATLQAMGKTVDRIDGYLMERSK